LGYYESLISCTNAIFRENSPSLCEKKPLRKISKTPFKILDAPNLQDDYYLNLIDWSNQDILAVALGSCVYLWSAVNNKVSKLCELSEQVTSVAWSPKGCFLSIGVNDGDIQIWDSIKSKKVNTFSEQHTARVGALGWSNNILCSGSRDKSIIMRDVRMTGMIRKLLEHKQEVCGIKWSFDEQQVASGGNDNKLLVWNIHSNTPVRKFLSHTAAVKAIAWSPHQHGLLASGGGTADRTIRFWNTLENNQIHLIDTDSQVAIDLKFLVFGCVF
jgi:cell division cycle 20-like protein 1 (cofactor of APC complex)